jgi:PE family
MSHARALPEALAAASADTARIGAAIAEANNAAATPTTASLVAGADEVSEAAEPAQPVARSG